jgi:hypothetical protein
MGRGGELDPSNHILSIRMMACWQPKARGFRPTRRLGSRSGVCKISLLPNSSIGIPVAQIQSQFGVGTGCDVPVTKQ